MKRKKYFWLSVIIVMILVAASTVCLMLLLSQNNSPSNIDLGEIISVEVLPEEKKKILPDKVDLQPVVDEWLGTIEGDAGIYIYDLDRNEMAASHNHKNEFATASVYKLFVAYEGYKLLENGEWQADDPAGVADYTILQCLDLAIRESNSACAEILWAKIGHNNLEEIVRSDFGLADTHVEELMSTPEDVAKMMQLYYYHEGIDKDASVEQLKDSFLNQPVTEYNWRQGLPNGFEIANVYNKVGWDYNVDLGYWNIYNDAAIVEFPDHNRHFIVVVMTNRVSYLDISRLGSMLEGSILESFSNN